MRQFRTLWTLFHTSPLFRFYFKKKTGRSESTEGDSAAVTKELIDHTLLWVRVKPIHGVPLEGNGILRKSCHPSWPHVGCSTLGTAWFSRTVVWLWWQNPEGGYEYEWDYSISCFVRKNVRNTTLTQKHALWNCSVLFWMWRLLR